MCEVGSNVVSDYVHLFAGIFFGGVVSYVVMLNLNYNIQQDLKNHNSYEVEYTIKNTDRFDKLYKNTSSEDEISEDEISEYDSEDNSEADENTSKNVVEESAEESIEESVKESVEETVEESVKESRETTSEENQLKLE